MSDLFVCMLLFGMIINKGNNNLNEREVNYKFDDPSKEHSRVTEEAGSKVGLPFI